MLKRSMINSACILVLGKDEVFPSLSPPFNLQTLFHQIPKHLVHGIGVKEEFIQFLTADFPNALFKGFFKGILFFFRKIIIPDSVG